jgi:hypothetical protein
VASSSQCHKNKCYLNKCRGARTHRHFPEWRQRGNKKPLNDIKSELNLPTLTETETEATNNLTDAKMTQNLTQKLF